ncbi:MAG TPA: DUF2267 domain-containing protein [Hyphomicrobiales bacterium]|nr:DUF2267 domain-containing protein [Hyphomicrobiales bacterium]
MSKPAIPLFSTTLQKTKIWLEEIAETTGSNERQAWTIIGAGLRAIRDRLRIELAAHLGAQLPLLVRGAYYDRFRPGELPKPYKTLNEFLDEIANGLSDGVDCDERDAAISVFGVLTRHLTPELVNKVRHALPEEIRERWPETMPLGHPIKSI